MQHGQSESNGVAAPALSGRLELTGAAISART